MEWSLNTSQLTLIEQQFQPTMVMWKIAQLEHPGVSGLMTGVFNMNPPKPKYVFIWDVEKVLSYFNNLSINEELLEI